MFPHSCHFPLVGQGLLEASCAPAGDARPIWPAAPGQCLSLFSPGLRRATDVREHLLAMAVVQGEAPALPLTSTSTEWGQASCACTNRN